MDNDRDTLTRQLVEDLSYSYRGVFYPDQVADAVNAAITAVPPTAIHPRRTRSTT